MSMNWLGLSIDFTGVADKTSEGSGFELLPEGMYRCTIKNVIKSVIGQNNKPALTITLSLDDEGDKEFTHNLFLPQAGDSENAIKFKNENLRNFFTRFLYKALTKDEYSKIPSADVNNELAKAMQTQPNFIGAKMLVHLKQDPFIAQDRETKALKFTDVNISNCLMDCPRPVLNLIKEKEEKGIVFEKMPVILFSNKIAAHGFGFYNDYDETKEKKNSKAYDYINALNLNSSSPSDTNNSDMISF